MWVHIYILFFFEMHDEVVYELQIGQRNITEATIFLTMQTLKRNSISVH